MDFFEGEPIGECKHCLNDVFTDTYEYNGELLCEDCYEYAMSEKAIVDYAEAYPDRLIEYLREVGVISEEQEVLNVLRDFQKWDRDEFDKWVVS